MQLINRIFALQLRLRWVHEWRKRVVEPKWRRRVADLRKRRAALAAAVDSVFAEDFHGRCLPFDATAAIAFAQIVASRTRKDGPISHEDAQIAAVALTHGFSLATRNTRDFIAIEGLVTIDPWR